MNKLLRKSEKIIKGIKSIEKEEKIFIRNLSYISHINKNKKEMQILFRQLMKSIKISFIEKENKIKYNEYYFNGLPIPKNIEFNDIETNSFKVLWKIDELNFLNLDKNEIKFRIEIKKENSKDEFIQVYEGNETNYIINNLEKDSNYEIKICSTYKNKISEFSEIQKIKTNKTISSILNESEKAYEFLEKLIEWTGYQKMELLYRGTKDGDSSYTFHNKCNNQGPTISLLKNDKNNIFGGYSSISWTSSGNYKSANGSFLFTLTNIHNTPPTKFPNTQKYDHAIYHDGGWGPDFGNDLFVGNCYLNNNTNNCCGSFQSYPDILGKGKSIFTGDLNQNNSNFTVKELEVFKVFN